MDAMLSYWSMPALVVGLIVAFFWLLIGALVSITRHPSASSGERAVWVLIVLLFPIVGPIVWFTLGKSAAGATRNPFS